MVAKTVFTLTLLALCGSQVSAQCQTQCDAQSCGPAPPSNANAAKLFKYLTCSTRYSNAVRANDPSLPDSERNCPTPDGLGQVRLDMETQCSGKTLQGVKEEIVKDCPSIVEIELRVNDLWAISGVDQKYWVDTYWRQTWYDARLRWNMSVYNYEYIDVLPSLQSRIWMPDTFVSNAISTNVGLSLLRIFHDGKVYSSRGTKFQLGCQMNFRHFPFDEQNCPIQLLSYGLTAGSLFVTSKAVGNDVAWNQQDGLTLTAKLTNPTWNITVADQTEMIVGNDVQCIPDLFSVTTMGIVFRRYTTGWMNKAIVPANLVLLIAQMQFYISPAAAPARVALGVISVLTQVNLKLGFGRNLPDIAYSTWLDEYLTGYIVFAVLAILEYAVVLVVRAAEDDLPKKPEMNIELAAPGTDPKASSETEALAAGRTKRSFFSRLCCDLRVLPFMSTDKVMHPRRLSVALDWHSRWIFPVCIMITNAIYFAPANIRQLEFDKKPDFFAAH